MIEENSVHFAEPERPVTSVTANAQFEFITGVAGSGKSYQCMENVKKDPSWALMGSTTGISAINMGTSTVNSILGYFDTQSLREIHQKGNLAKRLLEIRNSFRRLGIDEVSMLDGDQLTMIVEAVEECNEMPSKAPPLGIYLTGDFMQLPVVKGKMAFESEEWARFEAHTTRLTKVWRQTDVQFLNALNFLRAGSGVAAVAILENGGIKWHCNKMDDFDGTTLVAKNEAVNEFNQRALGLLKGQRIELENRRWGRNRGEWKNIPETLELKVGAYVTLLSNRYDEDKFLYANGDCGHVVDLEWNDLLVRLVRTGEVVKVNKVLRGVSKKHKPNPWFRPAFGRGYKEGAHWDNGKEEYVEGQIEYWPVRLAYASTIHRSQGLSLDRVQFDFTDQFAGSPAIVYVAMSRCRTMEGLRLVGTKDQFIDRCRIDEKCRRWL